MEKADILKGKRVLIVDDEKDVLNTVKDILYMCELDLASSFEEAKERLESRHYDLVVLDIMGVDGYRLLEISKRKNIPAAMFTAHAFSADNLKRSINEGACAYIPKEEMSSLPDFLSDIFKAIEERKDPWESWRERLPSSYFETRWGAAWKDQDRDFWERFWSSRKK